MRNDKSYLKAFIIQLLRRGTFRWKPRYEAKKAVKIDRGQYYCQDCGRICRTKEIKADHIEPVVNPLTGFTTWDEYINRMFPEKMEQFQMLCTICHDEKSKAEREIRTIERRKRKIK